MFSQWCSFGCLDEGLKGVCLYTLRNGQTEWNLNTPGAPEDERGWEEIDDDKRTGPEWNAIIQYNISSGYLCGIALQPNLEPILLSR